MSAALDWPTEPGAINFKPWGGAGERVGFKEKQHGKDLPRGTETVENKARSKFPGVGAWGSEECQNTRGSRILRG